MSNYLNKRSPENSNFWPKDRPEEEIQGYKKALDHIHNHYNQIEINPESIKRIHRLAQGGSISDTGQWKKTNNDIIEIDQSGERRVFQICIRGQYSECHQTALFGL